MFAVRHRRTADSILFSYLRMWWLMPAALAAELHDAIRARDLEMVRLLISAGAQIDEIGLEASPLHVAVMTGFVPATQRLLDAGANPELGGEPAQAHALHAAAHANQPRLPRCSLVPAPISSPATARIERR